MTDEPVSILRAVDMSNESRKSITPGLVRKINRAIRLRAKNGDYSVSFSRHGISDSDENQIVDIYTNEGYKVSFEAMSFITFSWNPSRRERPDIPSTGLIDGG